MTTKTNARTEFLAFVTDHGWELDPDETIYTGSSWTRQDQRLPAEYKQNPFAFRRPAKHGGTWKIELDYTDRSSSDYGYRRSTDNRLRKVEVRYFDAEGTEVRLFTTGRHFSMERIHPVLLTNTDVSTWQSTSWIWKVTYGPTGTATLRKRAEMLVADPDLVIWLAAEAQALDHQKFLEREAARRADIEARRRPLPEGWDALKRAAVAVERADGKTDVLAVLDSLRAALEAVEATEIVQSRRRGRALGDALVADAEARRAAVQ